MLLLGLLAFADGSRGLPAYGMTAFLGGLGVTAIATLATFGVLAHAPGGGHRRRDRRRPRTRAPLRPGGADPHRRGGDARRGPAACRLSLARAPDLERWRTPHYGWLAVVATRATLLTIIAAVRFIAILYADAGDEVPFTLGATPVLSRIVAGAACLAGIGWSC